MGICGAAANGWRMFCFRIMNVLNFRQTTSVQLTDWSKWTYRHRRRRRARRPAGVASGRHHPRQRRRVSASAASGAMAS